MMDTYPNQQGVQPLNITWTGKGSKFLGLSFKVFFLKVLTLFLYHFWGKTEVRKRLWNHTELNSQPLEYTGRGMELFLGFLIVIFVFFLPIGFLMGFLQVKYGEQSWQYYTSLGLFYMAAIYLTGVAIYSARRYRLSRTQWRGIRGAMVGSAWKFGITALFTGLVTIISLFFLHPWAQIKLQKILTDETRFGDMPMHFTGSATPLFKYYLFPWIGMLLAYGLAFFFFYEKFQIMLEMINDPTKMDPEIFFPIYFQFLGLLIALGLVVTLLYAWYSSRYYNYVAENTHFSNGNFTLTTTGGGLIWLHLSNFFIVLFSLGILGPVAAARLLGYFISNLSFQGTIDVAQIAQSQEELSRTGEGLAEGFDIDIF